MTNAALRGKPYAGNPHVRFDEGEVASGKPRRGSLPYTSATHKRKFLLGIFAAALAVASGVEAAITTPTLYRQCGYMNGYLNICFQIGTVDASTTLEVQTKAHGADESAYARAFTVAAQASYGDFSHNGFNGRYWRFATNLVGTIDVRVRLFTANDTTEWLTVEKPVSGYTCIKGTVIGTNPQRGKAFDGNMFSVCDSSGSVGYDFGAPIRIKGIRWFARPDGDVAGGGYGNCFYRILGSTFDYANDASFSDGVTILTCTRADKGGNTSPFEVNEHWFAEPITARYIRYNKSGTDYGGLNEFEVIPWDCPYKPVATVVRADITNFWPVVSWKYQAGLDPTEVRVERATAEAGPFVAVSDWMAASSEGGAYTNSVAYGDAVAPFVGVQYFYRVVAKTGNPSFVEQGVPQEVPSAVVAYRRYRRLERAWGAEGTLLSGVSVMTATNGTYDSNYALAWDGQTSTFPDRGTISHGPLGLKFTRKTSVGLFGYICRNDNYCYGRIRNTSLHSAAADDVALANKVLRSDAVVNASQDTTFYLQDATNIPDDGADCWFLYVTGNVQDGGYFGGNVAELMFFGWDEQDVVNAGVLVAPKTVSFANTADHLGVVLTWDAGSNASGGYAVERRVRGSSDGWTPLGSVAAGVTTFTDTTMTQGYWEYRVTAKKGDETATSPTFVRAYYAPADGTGLKRIVYWPFTAKATSFTVAASNELANGAVDFDFANGTPICAGGPTERMFLACEGTLIVPFAGAYTITHETSDGGSVWIDGVSAGGHWADASKTTSTVFELSVGEHPIRVYTRIDNSNVDGRRKSILKWSGPVGEETIPACQFRPAASAYGFGINANWDYRQFQGNDWGFATANGAKLKLRGSPSYPKGRTALNVCCAMMRGESPFCKLDFTVARIETNQANGVTGVIIHEDNGNALLFGFNTRGGIGNCEAACHVVTNGTDSVVRIGTSGYDTVISRWYRDLRFVYDKRTDTFRGYHRYETTNEWAQVFEFPNNGNFTQNAQIGFYVHGAQEYDNQSGAFDITVSGYRKVGGFCVILR